MDDTPVGSKSQARTLTTTSFAVLCVLALKDHPTYELTKQMRMSMHYLWPRAESNVYAEPKRLVEAGLAAARTESTGRRSRTVYSITPAGREALATWLASPSGRQRYESEAALKVLFAENGSLDDMLTSIRAIAADAAEALDHWQRVADRYDVGEGDYPERFAVSGLVARLLGEQQAATVRWAAWAEEVVSRWASPAGPGAEWGVEAVREAGRSRSRRAPPSRRPSPGAAPEPRRRPSGGRSP